MTPERRPERPYLLLVAPPDQLSGPLLSLLAGAGFAVHSADTVADGRRILQIVRPPGAVLVDLSLADEALPLLEMLRDPFFGATRVLLINGDSYARNLVARSSNDTPTTPLTPGALLALMRALAA